MSWQAHEGVRWRWGKRPRRIVACDGSAAWPQALPGQVAHGELLGACSSVALRQHPGGHRDQRRPQSAPHGRVTHQALEERAWAR